MQKKYVFIVDSIVKIFSICDTKNEILFSIGKSILNNISLQKDDKIFLYYKDIKNITTLLSVTNITEDKIFFKKEYEIANNLILQKNQHLQDEITKALGNNIQFFEINDTLFCEINNTILNNNNKDLNSFSTKIYSDFSNNITIPLIDSSFKKNLSHTELINSLGNLLKKYIEDNPISHSFVFFGMQIAPLAISENFSTTDYAEISKVAGKPENMSAEINKGVGAYKIANSLKESNKNFKFNTIITENRFKIDNFISIKTYKKSDYAKQFITSLLAKPFVILAGISGSGKTKIATDFATWLKKASLEDPKTTNSLLVSVGADWTDNTKILGYYNSIKEEYFKTEIIELIERANANETIPFFLILDEMNLSRVERYFSDFLSKMEENSDNTCFNLEKYKNNQGKEEPLKFPKNLFIIGTVNIDETTYMFSPKVLDRANVIEFTPDNVMENFENDLSAEDIPTAPDGTAESFLKLALETRKTKNLVLDDSKKRVATKILREIYNIFEGKGTESTTTQETSPESKETQKKEFKEFGFAYRTVKEIRHYINAAVVLKPDANINKVMDEQVLQKILPKIHGNRKQLETLLKRLKEICDKKEYDLTKSSKKIENMQKKLETNQFTSFI